MSDQVSMFLGHNTLLTFQQEPGDVWDPIRQRIQNQRLAPAHQRCELPGLLPIDAIVDHFFPILEHYGDRMDELETVILDGPAARHA